MRQILTAAAVAAGLIALWAVIVPLTAKPAPAQEVSQSETLSKALFLCRGPQGIDRACTTALAQALVLDEPGSKVARVSDQLCPADPRIFISLVRRS